MDRPIYCVNQFSHDGLPCAILKVKLAGEQFYLSAHVGITKRHPFYMLRAKDIDKALGYKREKPGKFVEFASDCHPAFGTTPIIWWVGFDHDQRFDSSEQVAVDRCKKLAEQLAVLQQDKVPMPISINQ